MGLRPPPDAIDQFRRDFGDTPPNMSDQERSIWYFRRHVIINRRLLLQQLDNFDPLFMIVDNMLQTPDTVDQFRRVGDQAEVVSALVSLKQRIVQYITADQESLVSFIRTLGREYDNWTSTQHMIELIDHNRVMQHRVRDLNIMLRVHNIGIINTTIGQVHNS